MKLYSLFRSGAFILPLCVVFCGIAAYGDGLVRLTHGGQTTDYATFAAAMGAAVNGDTLTLLDDIDAAPAAMSVDKSVTIDLDGHKIANDNADVQYSHNMLFVNSGAKVVFQNGTLHSRWQSVLIPNSAGCSITLTNCVVTGGTLTWSGSSDVLIAIGQGCVVTCNTLICGGAGNKVVVEDGEVYSGSLCTGGSLVVRGGRFAANPVAYLEAKHEVVSEKLTTSYGTTNYRVQPSALSPAVLIRGGSGEEVEFASVPLAVNAAADGDTVRLNKDWVDPGSPYTVGKAITLDLNSHAISNNVGYNMLNIAATPVVIKNGILSTPGNSSLVFNNGAHVAYLTNCLVTGSTLAYSPSAAELHIGDGCRFTCKALASGYVSGSNGSRVNVFVDSDDVICTSPGLFDSGAADGKIYSHVFVRGGKFAVNPSLCVVGNRKAVAQTTSTDVGTCSYAVVDRTGGETVVAEAVFPNGEAVKTASLADAVTAAHIGDTVRFLDDVQSSGSYTISKLLVYDLNGHTFKNEVDANFVYVNVDGCTIRNGTVWSVSQSVFVPQANVTLHVTDCTVKGNCAVYSSAENARVVFTGGRLESTTIYSTHATCKAAVEIVGSLCSNKNWADNPGAAATAASSLEITGCRSAISPTGFLRDDSFAAPLSYTSGGTTYSYVAFRTEDASQYDLSSFAAIGGKMYCATFAEAYAQTPDCGELKMVKDVEIADGFGFRKTLTLDLNGHTLTQTGNSSNFLQLYDGHVVTITGGGTIDKMPAGNSTFWIDGNGGSFEVCACRITGSTFAYGTSGSVRILSDDAVVESSALVSSHNTCKVTVRVEGGRMPSKVWDQAAPTGAAGGYVEAAGGSWPNDPFALAVLSPAFTVEEGLVARRSPSDQLYALVVLPETIDVDFSDATFPAYSYTGAVPADGVTVTVNLSVSGAWDGRRKFLGDFSGLANADKISFALGTVPTGYDVPFKLSCSDGRLYAGLLRGSLLLFR